jgi:hypothetical protein
MKAFDAAHQMPYCLFRNLNNYILDKLRVITTGVALLYLFDRLSNRETHSVSSNISNLLKLSHKLSDANEDGKRSPDKIRTSKINELDSIISHD